MKILKRILIIFTFILVLSSLSQAQLTLQEAVETALELNRELNAVRHESNAASEGIWETKSAYLPQISFQHQTSNSHSDLFDLDKSDIPPPFDNILSEDVFGGFTGKVYSNQFQFSQLIYDRSVIGRINMAQLREEAARWQELGQQQQVVFEVMTSYLDVLRANELLDVQKQRLVLANKQLDSATSNFKVGMRIKTDVLRAELIRSSALRDIVSAEVSRDQSIVTLSEIMGIPVNTAQTLEDNSLSKYDPQMDILNNLNEYELLFEIAESHNPAIQVASVLLEEQNESVATAKGEFQPSLRIGGNWGYREKQMNFEEEEWRVFAAVDIPIFEGGRRIAKIRRTQEEQNAQSNRFEDSVRIVQKSVKHSALALHEEYHNFQNAIEAVKVAEENQKQFQNLYHEGLANTLDVTQSITELVEAKTEVVSTRYNYMKLMAQLIFTLGTIPTKSDAFTSLDWLRYANVMNATE